MTSKKQLIFVYNADAGFANGAFDMMHKIFAPKRYSCQLCLITYGTFGIKKEWESFINQLSLPSVFLHKDEWLVQYHREDKLPAVFLEKGDDITTLIDAKTMEQQNLQTLQEKILSELERANKT